MALPSQPVTLSVEQLGDLYSKLSTMRHEINGDLAVIVAAVELIRLKPEMAERMLATLAERPNKIKNDLSKFSAELEKTLGITRS